MGESHNPLPWSRKPVQSAILAALAIVLIGWLFSTPAGLLGKADAVGYAVCHRIDLRSFHLGDRAISFCARCTGMYLGALLGLAYLQWGASKRGGRYPRSVHFVMGLLSLVWVGDSLNSFSNLIPGFPSLYTTTNTIRIFAGTGFGLVMAVYIFPAFNQTVWHEWEDVPPIRRPRDLIPLLGLGLLVASVVLSENPLFLYPASLLSAAGVVLILTMVYSMAVLLILKIENFAMSFRGLAIPLLLGLTLAMLQVSAADFIRFWLTGTWEGFHFG